MYLSYSLSTLLAGHREARGDGGRREVHIGRPLQPGLLPAQEGRERERLEGIVDRATYIVSYLVSFSAERLPAKNAHLAMDNGYLFVLRFSDRFENCNLGHES